MGAKIFREKLRKMSDKKLSELHNKKMMFIYIDFKMVKSIIENEYNSRAKDRTSDIYYIEKNIQKRIKETQKYVDYLNSFQEKVKKMSDDELNMWAFKLQEDIDKNKNSKNESCRLLEIVKREVCRRFSINGFDCSTIEFVNV